MTYSFPTQLDEIYERLHQIHPKKYAGTRNFVDGHVSMLSPYISRGVLSTRQVFEYCLSQGYALKDMYKFVQELAWRDYWQLIWLEKGDEIFQDLKRPQPDVANHQMPKAVVEAQTGIQVIDECIQTLYKTGYMHNHVRMYVAAIVCNIAKSHWKTPADWLYYHLLDADVASNALSWQWVAGANAGKKYYANQENINKYTHTQQEGTFMDKTYSELTEMPIPEVLKDVVSPELKVNLPKLDKINIDDSLPTYIYNAYNLDPHWDNDITANRVLLLDPSVFQKFPMHQKNHRFYPGIKSKYTEHPSLGRRV